MAQSVIQIKRSSGNTVPATLRPGEFAYSASETDSHGLTGGVLYIGGLETDGSGYSTNKYKIGGTAYTSILDVTAGQFTAGKVIQVGEDGKIDKIVADSIEGLKNSGTGETQLVIGDPNAENQKVVIHDPYVIGAEEQPVTLASYIDTLVKGGAITIVAGAGIHNITNENGTYTIALEPTGVTKGTYGSTTKIPRITVNEYGQLTQVEEQTISTSMAVSNADGSVNGTVDLLSGKLIGGDGLALDVDTSGQVGVSVDTTVVRTAGVQTINGAKTFGDTIPTVTPEQTLDSEGTQVTKLSTLKTEITYTDKSATGATVAVGGIAKGEKLSDMTFKEVIEKLLHPYVATTNVRLSMTPTNGGTFEVGDIKTLTGGTVSWTAGSTQVGTAEILKSGSPIGTATVSSGTSTAVTLDSEERVGSAAGTVSYSCRVKDNNNGKTINGGSVSFNHVYPFYYGVAASADAATGTAVASMTKVVQAKGSKTFAFTANNQVCVIAYPASYGNITKVLDQNNFDVTSTFVKKTDTVTGLDRTGQQYNIYTNAASTLSGFKFTFSF